MTRPTPSPYGASRYNLHHFVSLPPGARFGPYEILSPIGAGGMGEVYRARDTALHRSVAIKILPDSVAGDPERILRLQREARTLAALNDPNIAAIYGFVEGEGRQALVLELVEGPTLAERITRAPLSVAESVAIARQIAKALDAAHQLGIIHRDLKPANIKVREDGTVKVLDFGLSKAIDTGRGVDVSATPTITSPAVLTGAGVIVGSAAYMSPEQAKGLAADKRSDIWAFGCVLYEMLTGRRAFDGAGVTETLAAVLRGEPDWTALPSDLQNSTRTLLLRCLEKERSERVQDISTARFVLAEQAGLSGPIAGTISAVPRSRRLRTPWWIAAATIGGIATGAAAVWFAGPHPATSARTARFDLSSRTIDPVSAGSFGQLVAISPDGTRIVYVSMHDGMSRLMLRHIDQLDAQPIAGTEGAIDPFFSPDGRDIGFVVAGELRRVAVDGGRSVTIWRGDPTFEGAAWAADGTIVFSHDAALYRISANGGERTKIASPDPAREEFGLDRPHFLPDGETYLYTVAVRGGRSRIAARSMRGGVASDVLDGAFGAAYLAPGYLVYGQADRLMAIGFDAVTHRTSGNPVPLEQGVFTNPGDNVSNVAIARGNTAVFVSGRNPGVLGRLVWRSPSGARLTPIVDTPLEHPRNIRLSPDAKRLAAAVGPPGQANIWVYDMDGSRQPEKLTFSDHNNFPVWSPDGSRIAFMNMKAGVEKDLVLASDGSSLQPQPLGISDAGGPVMDWHGSSIMLFHDSTLWLLHPPDPAATQWLPMPFSTFGARFSPDGRWVAYTSTQSGAADVWVRPFPGNGAPVRVSVAGGHEPVWSHDGKDLFFTIGPKLMTTHMIASDPEPRFDQPRLVFEGGLLHDVTDLVLRFYDVAPDGRFVVAEPAETKSASIVIAQHWEDELAARRPH